MPTLRRFFKRLGLAFAFAFGFDPALRRLSKALGLALAFALGFDPGLKAFSQAAFINRQNRAAGAAGGRRGDGEC